MDRYKPKLDFFETERAVKLVKDTFEHRLAEALNLTRVTAPRMLETGNGLQDDLAATQVPVGFSLMSGQEVEIVHSLAKWKRWTLGKHGFEPGSGLYTDMDAIRKDEFVDPTHSVYVDQWDWEKVMTPEERNLGYLQDTVEMIYSAIKETSQVVASEFPALEDRLPKNIEFVHAQDLERMHPYMSPEKREIAFAEECGAYFLVGIGHPLGSGEVHDIRAADYDDWSTETSQGKHGLNGDIIIWDGTRGTSLEISSMGIRVDAESMLRQLKMMDQYDRKNLEFHQSVLEGRSPQSIGGGIGQSRLCMLLLQKAHIGEVQSSVWPDSHVKEMEEKGIYLL